MNQLLKPYTIKLFVPDGDPNSFKIINKMNWTGLGLEFSRDSWNTHKNRKEFDQAGIYILSGQDEDSDLPVIYIGQGDGIKKRVDSHYKEKLFWDKGVVFVSSNEGLNRAHITWLEWALIKRATETKRSKLDNGNTPNEPILAEHEKADIKAFLNEILSILPLIDIKVFEKAKKIDVSEERAESSTRKRVQDTVVVPAQEDGFKEVFLGEDCWYAIRIGGGKLNDIKYIAAYQTAPFSAITHYAEVESIQAYGDGGKYQLNFKKPAKEIGPIELDKKGLAPQSPRYTSIEKLLSAKKLSDIF